MPLAPPITVVTIDDVAHELTKLALEDTLSRITPVQVLIYTDDPQKIKIEGADYQHFDGDYLDVMSTLWYYVPRRLAPEASHLLWLQWDSGVLSAEAWTDKFLEHDYVGAPWPVSVNGSPTLWDKLGYTKDTNVGNGGFSLRSKSLVNWLADHRDTHPLWLPEDDAICRRYRALLGKFAPASLASRFSAECGGREVTVGKVFGFHNCANWSWALTKAEREIRFAKASPFVRQNTSFQSILKAHDRIPDFPLGHTFNL